ANEFCMRYAYVADLAYKRGQLFTGVTAEHFSRAEQAGVLRAFDVNQNKVVWEWSNRTPLISHTLSTAGNLVFQGTAEGRVVAVRFDGFGCARIPRIRRSRVSTRPSPASRSRSRARSRTLSAPS